MDPEREGIWIQTRCLRAPAGQRRPGNLLLPYFDLSLMFFQWPIGADSVTILIGAQARDTPSLRADMYLLAEGGTDFQWCCLDKSVQ